MLSMIPTQFLYSLVVTEIMCFAYPDLFCFCFVSLTMNHTPTHDSTCLIIWKVTPARWRWYSRLTWMRRLERMATKTTLVTSQTANHTWLKTLNVQPRTSASWQLLSSSHLSLVREGEWHSWHFSVCLRRYLRLESYIFFKHFPCVCENLQSIILSSEKHSPALTLHSSEQQFDSL